MRPTDKTTPQLANLLRRWKPRDVGNLVQAFDAYTRQIERCGDTSAPEAAAGVAAGLLDVMNDAIAARMARDPNAHRIACKPGCSHCCRVEVRITRSEAFYLIHGMQELDAKPNAARIAAQAGIKNWTDIPQEFRACAFLGEDGKCTVYDYRPGACRKYFAVDTPDACDTVKEYGAQVVNLVIPEAEVISSALMSRDQSGPMAEMILKALDQMQEEPQSGG